MGVFPHMSSSLRRFRRDAEPARPRGARRRRHKIALLLPAVVVASTVLSGPAHADDVDDPAPASPDSSQTAPAPDPAPSDDPKPEPKPEPAPEPKPAPEPEPSDDPAPAPAAEPSDARDEKADTADAGKAPQAEPVAVSPSAGTVFSAAAKASGDKAAVPAAANEKKVVVCKYVSTPPGYSHHVIVPSVNSLKDWDPSMGFPSFAFADAHDSIVIRYLGDDEIPGQVPNSACPNLIKKPVPQLVNPCGPDNAVWADLTGTGFTAVRQLDGSLVVTASPGYWFAPLTIPPTTEFTIPAPVDSDPDNQACQGAIVPPAPQAVDECGDGIVQWADPAESDDYTWKRNQDGSVTFTAVPPAVFPGGESTYSWPAPTAEQEACPKKVVVCKYVTKPGGVQHHIVIVSVNAVDPSGSGKTWDQVTDADFPFPFEDAQDSIAIGFADKGDQSHDFTPEDCGTKVDPPVVPEVDPCNPTGVTSNIAFGAVPEGPWTADTSVAGQITFTATGSNYFGTTGEGDDKVFVKTHVVKLGSDSGEKCLIAPAIAPNDPCNPAGVTANATWVLPAETADYSVSVVDGVIKLIAKLGKVFESGQPTYTYNLAATPTDSGVACEVGGVEETVNTSKDEVDSAQAATGLPNTGGPAGWLMPLGVGLVLAGAGLVLGRRRTA